MKFLFVPGINNTAATFDGVARAMPARHDTIAVNCAALPDVDAIARDLLARAPDQFVVAGHSFGGYVALAMLAAGPDRVTGIVLMNSNDSADPETVAEGRLDKARKADEGGYAELAEAASARAYHPDNSGRADLMAERHAALSGYGAERFAAHMRASAARPDRSVLLKNCGKPILVVSGDADVVIPTARQVEMAKRLRAEQRTIAIAGHMLPAEQPDALAATLTAWADARFPTHEGA